MASQKGRVTGTVFEKCVMTVLMEVRSKTLTMIQDSQLWFKGGDCLVHFSAHRASQRGPSLKIPFDAVEELDCEYLSNHCLRTRNKLSPIPSEDGHSDSGYGSELEKTEYELYIPAPAALSKDQAFEYHLTTRNIMAYAVGKPLVGERLSTALRGVWRRMQDWHMGSGSLENFKAYCKGQGYLDLTENAEHALAFLKFADTARLKDLWIEAFVHCVGMHSRLDLSPEWSGLSNTTVALITRASLEMDLHIARIVRAVGGFLEEELGAEHLGLSRHARDHLDRFRSFLHAFYVEKLGYFPPKQKISWNKRLWSRVHHDFQCLYDYLVDRESTFDLNGNRGATGGVCAVQNLTAFDHRHGYDPLSHPLPLLPAAVAKPKRGVSSQRGLRTLSLGMTASAPELRATTRQVLETASNRQDEEVMACALVQEYRRFERQRLEEKLEIGEARKIRWILIYASLQMLNSIMKAPKEVADTMSASYPLCSVTTGCPPWKEADPAPPRSPVEPDASPLAERRSSLVPDAKEALEGRTSRISIHPDCEADSAEQFFASNAALSRSTSQADLSLAPSPLRINTQLNRRNSLRESMHSSVNLLHKSVLGSLSRRGSSRRNSLVPEPKKMPSFCEIVVEGYGNGLEFGDTLMDEPESLGADDFLSPASPQQPATNAFALFDFGLGPSNDEPTLEDPGLAEAVISEHFHVDHPDLVDTSPRDSHVSDESALYGISSEDSYEDPGTPVTDVDSSDEGDLIMSSDNDKQPFPRPHTDSAAAAAMQLQLHSYIPSKLSSNAGGGSSTSIVHGGCYTPTGLIEPPRSRFSHLPKSPSQSSVASGSSSVYADEATQADDIAEEDARGRRRSRAMDSFVRMGVEGRGGFEA